MLVADAVGHTACISHEHTVDTFGVSHADTLLHHSMKLCRLASQLASPHVVLAAGNP